MTAVEAWHAFPSPGLIKQLDGSTFGGRNCAAATWAGLIVAQQQGKHPAKGSPWYPTGASLRDQSGDRAGGILPSLLDTTVNRVYGIDLIPRIVTVATVDVLLDEGYALGFLHQYAPIASAGLSASPGFLGAHSGGLYGSIVGQAWLYADPLADGRRTGIPKGMRYVTRSVLIKAGESLVINAQTGETVRQRYGSGHIYIVQTTVPYRPAAPAPPPLARVVTSAPATADERRNPMLLGAYGVTGSRVMHLAATQPLFKSPGGPRVTRMSRAGTPTFVGKVDGGTWGAVVIGTGVPYHDGQTRPTVLYVPMAAGTVVPR